MSYPILKELNDNALIINTARKEVINEEDLLRIMEEKPGVKYLTDVEPTHKTLFAEKFKGRFYSTPKNGAQTEEANSNAGKAAAEQIVAFLEHGDISCKVN